MGKNKMIRGLKYFKFSLNVLLSACTCLFFVNLCLCFSVQPVYAQGDALTVAPLNPEFLKWQNRLLSPEAVAEGAEAEINFGYIPSPFDWSHLQTELPAGRLQLGIPGSYDLRTVDGGLVTPVRDQGACGGCWTFGTYGSLEGWLKKNESEEADFSENHLKNYHGFDWGPCDGGNEEMSAAYLTRWDGPVSELDDPYNDYDDRPSPGGPPQKYVKSVLRFATSDNIKNAVMTYGALYTSMYYAAGSYNSATKTYYYSGSADPNHAVTLVGWDDTKVVTGAPGNGAWIIKNSWGTTWGESGYFYISYYDSKAVKYALTYADAVDASEFDAVYYYDPLGMISAFGCGPTTWGANIFTPSANGYLGAVGFYAVQNNTAYEIKIYDNFSGGLFSSLLGSVSGTAANAGYYTIMLPSQIALTIGNSFGVIGKFTTTGYDYPVAFEYSYPGYSSAATAAAGQSYYSCDGTTFYDLTEESGFSTANVSLKALTVPDTDADGMSDFFDNCSSVSNPDQADMDGDAMGDVCDPDIDGDGVLNGADNCSYDVNPGQADADTDGMGDTCDACPSTKPVKIIGTSNFFDSVQSALSYGPLANGDVVGCQDTDFIEDVNFNQAGKTITIKGGYACDYSTAASNATLYGSLTISAGTVTVENIVIQ